MLRLKRETPTAYLWSINSQLPPLQHDELTPKRWDLWWFRKARLSVAEKYILKMPFEFKFTTKEGMNVITWLHYDKWQVWLQAARRQQYVSPFQTIHPPVKYDPIPKSDHLNCTKKFMRYLACGLLGSLVSFEKGSWKTDHSFHQNL